jgi:hypothetical protein
MCDWSLISITVQREYDIFERFPDSSSLWRICIRGRYEVQRELQDLAEHSENEFFAIDIKTGVLLPVNSARKDSCDQMKHAMKQTA